MAGGSNGDAASSRGWAPLDAAAPSPPPSTTGQDVGAPPAPPTSWPPPPRGYAPPQTKAGDARTGPLPMHPMSVGDILDGAFKLFKANARTLLLIVCAIVVPLQVLSAFFVRKQLSLGLDALFDPTLAEQTAPSDVTGALATMVAGLLAVLTTPFVAGAVSRVVAASYLGHEITVGAALKSTLRRFGALLGSFLLVHILELAGFVACILPGLLLMALFTAVAPAIAIEEIGPIQGMRRSWRLIQPRMWAVLGISLLAGMIGSALSNVLGGIPSAVGTVIGGSFAWLLLAIGGILGQLVATPLAAIVATLIYFDARIRNEGFDLQVMARDLER